jgi:tripartite-type tricarboxylate transporter receptor subunit TctC
MLAAIALAWIAMHAATREVLRDEDSRAKIVEQGAEAVGNSSADFCTFVKAETDRLSVVIRSAKIALD